MMHTKARVLRALPNAVLRFTLFQRKAFYALVLTGLLLLILMRFPYLDVALADIYFDADQQIFPWKNTWFAKTLMHEYVKLCLQYVGLALCIAVLSDIAQPWFSNAWLRVRLRFVALSAVSIPLVITLLKRTSVLHCPWDIDRYGGVYPFIAMFDPLPAHMIAGHCFPAGHATSGLWLAACAVFLVATSTQHCGPCICNRFNGWFRAGLGAANAWRTLFKPYINVGVVSVLLFAHIVCAHTSAY